MHVLIFQGDSRLAPSQWGTSLQSNAVFHWLGANQNKQRVNKYLNNLSVNTSRAHDISIVLLYICGPLPIWPTRCNSQNFGNWVLSTVVNGNGYIDRCLSIHLGMHYLRVCPWNIGASSRYLQIMASNSIMWEITKMVLSWKISADK